VALCRALKGNTKLRKLNLRQNEIGIRGGRELGEMLSSPNLRLQKLNISWNCIKGQGSAALCSGLGENKFLQRLDASWNYFREDSALELGNALARNKSLLHINLEHCGVNDVAAVSLSVVESFTDIYLISPRPRY
jgi:Ran GTPase-activating protein (RanGAP) involved in mRNA processing and transport